MNKIDRIDTLKQQINELKYQLAILQDKPCQHLEVTCNDCGMLVFGGGHGRRPVVPPLRQNSDKLLRLLKARFVKLETSVAAHRLAELDPQIDDKSFYRKKVEKDLELLKNIIGEMQK